MCVCVGVWEGTFCVYMRVHPGRAYNNSVVIIFVVCVEQLSALSPRVDWKALPAVSPGAVSRKPC